MKYFSLSLKVWLNFVVMTSFIGMCYCNICQFCTKSDVDGPRESVGQI